MRGLFSFSAARAAFRVGVNFYPPETAGGGSAPTEREFVDVVVAGRRPKVTGLLGQVLIAVVLYFAIAPYVIRFDAKFLPIVLILLLAAGVRSRIKAFRRPPRATIEKGEFSLRLFPNLVLNTPAANIAMMELRAGRMTVTFGDPQAVEPAKWRMWLKQNLKKQGAHATTGRDLFSLEQVNQLRAALGMPPQAADRFVDFEHVLKRLTPRVVVTPALIAANVAVFLALAVLGARFFSPDEQLLIQWGANYGPLTRHGEWWRLVSNIFLHFGVLHLLMNMYVLRDIGPVVERLVGPVGFAVGYLVSGFFGSVASAYWHDASASVGASGPVFGLFGMLLGMVTGRQDSIPAALIKAQRANAVMFVVLNLALGSVIPVIDQAAHLGGFAAGCVCGLVMRGNLPVGAGRRTSRSLTLAAAASVAGAVAVHLLSTLPPDIKTVYLRAGKADMAANSLFAAAIQRQQSGAQSAAETGAEIKKSILPMYVELADQLEHVPRRHDAQRDRMKTIMAEYVQLQLEGWEMLGQAFEHNNKVARGLAELRFEAAQRLIAAINPAANNKQVHVPTDFHKEFAVLAVAEAQAMQALAALHEKESQGNLGSAENAAAFDRDVLSIWQAGKNRFLAAARDFPPEDRPLVARTRKYIDLKTAGLLLILQSLRDGDQTKAVAGHKKLDESAKAEQAIWPKSPEADAEDATK